MKIIVIGASGTVGTPVVAELAARHEVVRVGRSSGDVHADIRDPASIQALFDKVGKVDAVVSAAGKAHFGALTEMTPALYDIGIRDKLMGQVTLALTAIPFLRDGGSITLTSGILSEHPIRSGSSAAMVNGAIDAFVRAAAIEMPRGIRINSVSATVLVEALDHYGPYFRGYEPAPGARVALAFSKSVEGAQTGQVYRVY